MNGKSIIVAYDQNRGIGRSGEMPWSGELPNDLRHFKELTIGKSVIMGRKTLEAIGRPLPGRHNIVLSRSTHAVDAATVCHSLQEAYKAGESAEIMVIGGGQIYKEALADVHRIYATEIDASFDRVDAFFPEIDRSLWNEISREDLVADEKNHFGYSFVTYERIAPA